MSRVSRWLVVIAVLCLGVAQILPLWEVRLIAPQYPEGLGLLIRANAVTGIKPSDLQSINGLNHYIGMKAIEPEAIPELHWMPWILIGLGVAALLVAAIASRRLLLGWLIVFALVGGVGVWDFYRWEYDYGHNLDMENAIIVVPGMNYQPPMIGSKQLLNFTATSWPAPGGWALGASFALGAAAWTIGRSKRRAIRRMTRTGTVFAQGAV